VNGVYTADPEKHPDAVQYESIQGAEVLQKNLRVMDLTAITLCKESGIPIIVFNINEPGNLLRILRGEPIGTRIHWTEEPTQKKLSEKPMVQIESKESS